MSRVGKSPISIPQDVSVNLSGQVVSVKGPMGELSFTLPETVKAKQEGDLISFETKSETKPARAAWGTSRALVANMIKGVTSGYEKTLELVGVGYRAAQSGPGLSISIGYSKPVMFNPPEGITLKLDENGNIIISGIDKQQVGLVAAQIRAIRPPEPYKGKGIKYNNEVIRRKAGKSGKA